MHASYLKKTISFFIIETINELYKKTIDEKNFSITLTKPEFKGDYTLVLFSLSKILEKNIPTLANEIAVVLINKYATYFKSFNIQQGFLNLEINDLYYTTYLNNQYLNATIGKKPFHGEKVMIEYSSPNTNKPLHLGHLRNNFLGYSISKIYEWNGYDVFTSCIVNDRGVHICKSMLAWQLWGNNNTPESTNKKGDHFVGDYYVLFSNELKKQIAQLKSEGMNEEEAEKNAPLMKAVHEMLILWEQGDEKTLSLWKTMNEWVYKGFNDTYKKIGTSFNKTYYESETYLLGKKFVEEGVLNKQFFKKDDGSVWINLENDGLDKKLLLRKDGTSVYITQDLGLADFKYQDFKFTKSIYVVGDEQNYHFQVLKLILSKLNKSYSQGIIHLSYGMVELPSGKMKSREGTVVDADDIINDMIEIAKQHTIELGKVNQFNTQEFNTLIEDIGMAALKFYLLKVEPKKKMIFNPEESIDFHGFTGPFIQYTFARIQSVLQKNNDLIKANTCFEPLEKLEKEWLIEAELFEYYLEQSLIENNPSLIAVFAFNVAKKFNAFYAQHSILQEKRRYKK